MIKSIRLFNFQKWKKLCLEFGPVTTIVGDSEAGKTSVLRALRWVCLNRPSGDKIRRRLGKGTSANTSVTIEADDHKIKRVRGERGNLYFLDGRRLEAFHPNVPEPITQILKVDENNFHQQISSPFWLGDSPGQISKALNGIIDLSAIDRSLSNVGQFVRNLETELRITRDREKEAKEKKDGLEWVREASDDLTEIEELRRLHTRRTEENETLQELIEEIRELRSKRKKYRQVQSQIRDLIKLSEQAQSESSTIDRLGQLIKEINRSRKECRRKHAELKSLRGELTSVPKCPECGQYLKDVP